MVTSGFHPTVQSWFRERLGAPTPAQEQGWPHIQAGRHVLIAAPTGSGKTLAAFLAGIDALLREGAAAGGELPAETRLLYVSPLKALGNDVQKNLRAPLEELRQRDPSLPEIDVLVRSGDTPASRRTAMTKRPPHVLVTTPESLYILLTTEGGRRMLRSVRSVVVDEIHALAGDKRGAHLALSLERLEALAGPVQRIGLSATQRPIEAIGRFLTGTDRPCEIVDTGHRRTLDIDLELPESPLEAVCSHQAWGELYQRMATRIEEHRTTLVFVNTRKLAERVAARLGELLGTERVASHHGSLSKERRLEAERRLKEGELRALVATASLELGIDVGDVDLVIQVGGTRSIATFLQRVGRAGHGVGRIPKGRLLPLTRDELVESVALLRAVRRGELDRTCLPEKPLDLLAQQVVAACVAEDWEADALFQRVRRAWPYRDVTREEFDAVCDLHTVASRGRGALLHRDGVAGRLRATRRARLVAITSGGAIPDTAQYRVLEEPHGTLVGTLDEDFAVESSRGDVFQLGTTSWAVLKIEPGIVRVANAHGAPPTVPFWLGEAPARTRELSAEVAALREDVAARLGDRGAPDVAAAARWLEEEEALPRAAAEQLAEFLAEGLRALGTLPTQRRLVVERFFDESGGMQLVVHAPFGGRLNRALGLALRKRFCRRFGFELQAAANEDAIVLSLGPHHSFPLEEVLDYLHPDTARDVLTQALLASPLFTTRWRWNVSRSLLVPRFRGGKRTPAPLLRMRAEDELVRAFPAAQACPETLPGGDLEVPRDHPIVRQTIDDCLTEAMDVESLIELLRGLRDGSVERVAVDLPGPSVLAHGVLTARPYAFLDDAPLEERRVQAVVLGGRGLPATPGEPDPGLLDPEAVARVREQAWPRPRDAEEVHEALSWMGFVEDREAPDWRPWLDALAAAGRVVRDGERWLAAESSREPVELWRGRLQALGPVEGPGLLEDPALLTLEQEGVAVRVRLDDARWGWCDRRLLARIQRARLERLRREVEPVSAAVFWRFLGRWQRADPRDRVEGPQGVLEVIEQLAGYEIPAEAWERHVLPARVTGYRRSYLDELTLSGRVVWGRLWGSGAGHARSTPVCLLPRDELDLWRGLAGAAAADELSGSARAVHDLLERRGAQFLQDLERRARLLPEHLEGALTELIGKGLVTCDAFAGLRGLLVAPSRRRHRLPTTGRWSLFRTAEDLPAEPADPAAVAAVLLRRTGVVFKTLLERERMPVTWRDLLRALRHMELRGEVRGGRLVAGFWGEQYALPAAVKLLRDVRREGASESVAPSLRVAAADPLNLQGILTPEEKVARTARREVVVGG